MKVSFSGHLFSKSDLKCFLSFGVILENWWEKSFCQDNHSKLIFFLLICESMWKKNIFLMKDIFWGFFCKYSFLGFFLSMENCLHNLSWNVFPKILFFSQNKFSTFFSCVKTLKKKYIFGNGIFPTQKMFKNSFHKNVWTFFQKFYWKFFSKNFSRMFFPG